MDFCREETGRRYLCTDSSGKEPVGMLVPLLVLALAVLLGLFRSVISYV
ncbi:MAG: MYXO-CTERM sorting domain-containing protein [Gallintestinimicrobium sp.]